MGILENSGLTPIWKAIRYKHLTRSCNRHLHFRNPELRKVYRDRYDEKSKAWVKQHVKKPEVMERKKIYLRTQRANKRHNQSEHLKHCTHCGSVFTDLSKNMTKKFCEIKCKRQFFQEYYRLNGNWKFYKKTRRARENNVTHSFTEDEWLNKVLSTKGICPLCKSDVGYLKLSLDHILPLSKAPIGYNYSIDKVQPLCLPCNRKKNDTY